MAAGRSIAAWFVALAVALPLYASGATREYRLKAEFLERFTRFIEWPDPEPELPFQLCVIGGDPFEGYLQEMTRERQLKGRAVELRTIASTEALGGCNLVFIAEGARPQLHEIVEHTTGKPVLTVSDIEGSARQGALISFYEEAGTVRFSINSTQAKRSGLEFSSQLLRLARIVAQEEE